jgi:hypothetical protein
MMNKVGRIFCHQAKDILIILHTKFGQNPFHILKVMIKITFSSVPMSYEIFVYASFTVNQDFTMKSL